MAKQEVYHAIKVDQSICYGCTHCMHVCPTNAIRINEGKAHILSKKCVDCGLCLRNCPVQAIFIEQDDLDNIFQYKYRVALVPVVFTGQFPQWVSEGSIFNELHQLGFTHVFHAEQTVDLINELANDQSLVVTQKPQISSFCPAVVRLIQMRFPALQEHIIPILPPADASALYYRRKLMQEGISEHDIGVFYVTPCAAKIAAIKSQQSNKNGHINGVINMSYLYSRVLKSIKNKAHQTEPEIGLPKLSSMAMGWSLAHGEADSHKGTSIAVDEIHNVIDFLELVEDDEVSDVDFLELRACDQGCAGGALLQGNRFLTVKRIKAGSDTSGHEDSESCGWSFYQHLFQSKEEFCAKIPLVPNVALDEDFDQALRKMERIRDLMCYLPGIDCGACGSPSCQTLAEDIVQNQAHLSDCVFIQRIMEKNKKLHHEHAIRIIEKKWGKARLDKDCKKRGAKNEGL